MSKVTMSMHFVIIEFNTNTKTIPLECGKGKKRSCYQRDFGEILYGLGNLTVNNERQRERDGETEMLSVPQGFHQSFRLNQSNPQRESKALRRNALPVPFKVHL